MAYFNLAENPNTAIKSKSSGGKTPIDLTDFHPSNGKAIGDDWDVQPGDVISWGNYRADQTYFVDKNRHLQENEDTSGSGYLTIPISISRLFPSALKHYESFLEQQSCLVSAIILEPTDGIFAERFGSPLPDAICNRKDITYLYDPVQLLFFVTVGNEECFEFSIDGTKTKDIVDYIDVAKDKKSAFTVTYDIKEEEAYKKWPGHLSSKLLPAGWSCEQYGTTHGGSNTIQGAWKIKGPEKSKDEAHKIAEKYYDGFGVKFGEPTH